MYSRRMFSTCFAFAGMFLAACGPSAEQRQQLSQLPVVVGERDQLQSQVEGLTAEIGRIETELAKATVIPAATKEESQPASASAAVGELVTHVGEMEQELSAAATRLRSVNASSDAQRQRITELEASIASEQAAMDGQRERITSLEAAIADLEAETARQGEANQQLERTVDNMTNEANTVWYVAGTKEELLDRGVVREEGGSRVLFIFGKRGKTLVPSRTADPTMFTAVDRRRLGDIALPDAKADTKWTVVTPQDLGAVGSPLDDKDRIVGDALTIADPERFWANSRYLILVQS